MSITINIKGYNITLGISVSGERIEVDDIFSVDGEDVILSSPTHFPMIYLIETYMQKELIAEYKRQAEEEKLGYELDRRE